MTHDEGNMSGQTLGQIPNHSIPNLLNPSQLGENDVNSSQQVPKDLTSSPFPFSGMMPAWSLQRDYYYSYGPIYPFDCIDGASTDSTKFNMVFTNNTDQLHFVKGEPFNLPNATFIYNSVLFLVLGLIIFFCRK